MRHGLPARGFCLLATAILWTNATERAAAQASRPVAAAGLALQVDGVTFDFVRIEPGRFTMGSPHSYVDEFNWTYEMPAHEVTIRHAYSMGVTEVTVEQFRLFVEQTGYITDAEKQGWAFSPTDTGWRFEYLVDWRWPGYAQTDREPVVCLDWHDAMAFCRWLSEKTGQDIRLPSEAEWEYACRAGTTGEHAGSLDAMAWYAWNSASRTHPVGQKQPNAWGLYDMNGNAWEWVQDLYHRDCAGAPTDGSAWLDTTDVDPRGITRGGSFYNPAWLCRSYIRMQTPLGSMVHSNNGFRLVLATESEDDSAVPATASPAGLAPVEVALPTRVFEGTPKDFRAPRTKPVQTEVGPPFLAPAGTKNVALGKPVSSSDAEPITGDLQMVTDGDKEAADGSYVELGPLLQYVTIDLEVQCEIYGVRVWHFHKEPRVYFDVVIQISNDPDFIDGVKTIFNNDMDNSAGLGIGTDMHYVDTHFGEIFDARGLPGRYVRLYSRGNTATDTNHYIEVEVYGRPAAKACEHVPLRIEFPKPMFTDCPFEGETVPRLKSYYPPATVPVPQGTTNVSLGKTILSSSDPLRGSLDMICDGKKDGSRDRIVDLPSGVQCITIDLGSAHVIQAVQIWHALHVPNVCYDVVVQVSNDPDFIDGVGTIFNNDIDNSAGCGVGQDWHYRETYVGLLIDAKAVHARYVRFYSNGNTSDSLNHYLEVEVYGRPARQERRTEGRRREDSILAAACL